MSDEFDNIDMFDISDTESDIATNKKLESNPIVSSEVEPLVIQSGVVTNNPLTRLSTEVGSYISPDKLSIIDKFMERAKYGHQASLPLVCKGLACPFLRMCVLHQVGAKLPLEKPCPIEGALIEQWVQRTIAALKIDPSNEEYAVDMDMIYELAGMELIRMRAGYHLAIDGSLSEERIVGYSPQGDPIYDEKPRVSLLVLEKYSKVISKLREQLLATRKAQAQVGQIASDPSVRTANIMAKAKALINKRKDQANNIADASFEIK
jgi:hypothetical protein